MATVDLREVPTLDERLAFIVGTSAETVRRFHGAIEACGYRLAPVAPDPGLREAIREAVKSGMIEQSQCLKNGSVKEIFDSTADAVLAVLAERGVR